MGEEKSRHQFLLSKLCRCSKSNLVLSQLLHLSFSSVKYDISLFWQHMLLGFNFFPLALEQKEEKNYFWEKKSFSEKIMYE